MLSFSLHWVNNLPKLFREVKRCLRNDCAFTGAMFAGDTLFELRVSLQLAEMERRGVIFSLYIFSIFIAVVVGVKKKLFDIFKGITPRISPFTTPQDISGLLNTSGFKLLTLDFDEIRIAYPSIFELMYDLKGMAENNASNNRKLNLNKDLLIAAQSIYKGLNLNFTFVLLSTE